MCESLFPCETSVEEIRKEALFDATSPNNQALPTTGLFSTLFAPTADYNIHKSTTDIREGRSTCKISGQLCPGITIGCALCGVFAPGTCGDTCIIAGLYCGTSGYACQYEASLNSSEEDSGEGGEEGEGGESGDEPAGVVPADEAVESDEDSEGSRRKASRPRFYPFHF